MRFLVDAQLPPALVRLLREHDDEAEHVTGIGPADASDRDIWRSALEQGAVIVTKDEDYADTLAIGSREGPAVVWVRVGNTRRAALLAWFEPLIDRIIEVVHSGDRLIELRWSLAVPLTTNAKQGSRGLPASSGRSEAAPSGS